MYRPSDTPKFVGSRPIVECAQCSERLFVPEWSDTSMNAACAISGNVSLGLLLRVNRLLCASD